MTLPVRADLLRLSPEALAHLSNLGLVKRAMKELDSAPPALFADAQGGISAHFADGAQSHWPVDAAMKEARCSCGAANSCRHRIALALAYQSQSQLVPSAIANPAQPPEVFSALFPSAIQKLAHELERGGLRIALRAHAASGFSKTAQAPQDNAVEPCPTARLPAATVRYWGGDQLASAKCDCLRATLCEHVYLGAKAFYLLAQKQADADIASTHFVQLGGMEAAVSVDMAPVQALTHSLWQFGIESGALRHAQCLSLAKAHAAALKATWLMDVLADLEHWMEAYENRSADFEILHGLTLVNELALRIQVGVRAGFAKTALGIGVAHEVALDQVRLLCLGIRIRPAGESQLEAQLLLADLDTGTQTVLLHRWRQDDSAPLHDTLNAQRLAPGLKLLGLAQGQLLTKGAKRLANGMLKLAKARADQNALLLQRGDWQKLPSSLRYANVRALHREVSQRAHPAIVARHAQPNFCVLAVHSVQSLYFDASQQRLVAVLIDSDGETLIVQRDYEAHLPQALDAMAAALRGNFGMVTHIAGIAHFAGNTLHIEPFAICADRVVSIDCEASGGQLAHVELAQLDQSQSDPMLQALQSTQQLLADYLFRGWQHAAANRERTKNVAAQLATMELAQLAGRVRELLAPELMSRSLQRAALRAALTLEQLR